MVPELEARPKVLVVDDNPQNVDLLEAYLVAGDYDVLRAFDGEDALEKIAVNKLDLIIMDIMMPKLNGYEVCRRLKCRDDTRLIPVIMLTALNELNDKVKGIESGADDFLSKPFNSLELLARVRSLINTKRLNENLESAKNIIVTLSLAIEAHDSFSSGHSERVSFYCEMISRELGLNQHFVTAIREAAILHDLGKIGIAQKILHKPGPLTAAEYFEIQKHPIIGEKICEPLKSTHLKLPVIRHHHERIDGRGYPDKLAGTDIPLGARIMAIADAFDAMISDRPYRHAMPIDQAISVLQEESGKQWDGELVGVFISCLGETSSLKKVIKA